MRPALSVSWNDAKKGPGTYALLALLLTLSLLAAPLHTLATSETGRRVVEVIVRGIPGGGDEARTAIADAGGTIRRPLSIIDGYLAEVPQASLPILESNEHIRITPNQQVQLLHSVDGYDASADPGSSFNTAVATRARSLWYTGVTGRGVDVALIDSGVVPVNGLTTPGKIVNGPDLSYEGQAPNLRYLDTHGHGTHMAGIIAGLDNGTTDAGHDNYIGIAPEARIVNIKVADAYGRTDVSQVIAAIDWVVQHRNDNGLNIRVLNLSFGTDGVQDYVLDPLTYATEVAWRNGIVVVAAAGNKGFGNAKLNNPAYDPYVIAVGASDTKGTNQINDDIVPSWSSRGNAVRHPDLVAPGKSIVGLRDPGSYLDVTQSGGRVNSRFFRGSGTSQAAAVVSGAAALLIDQRPSLTPDQVKALLRNSARRLPNADLLAQGEGMLDLRAAGDAPTPLTQQTWAPATGLGSLNESRGSAAFDNTPTGEVEVDVFGTVWDAARWASSSWSSSSWSGGDWSSSSWSGSAWQGGTWNSSSWSSSSWSSSSWSSSSWSSSSWSSTSWSSSSWSSSSWSSSSWSSSSWSSSSWSSSSWSSSSWSSSSWS